MSRRQFGDPPPSPYDIATTRRWISAPPDNYVPASRDEEDWLRAIVNAGLDAMERAVD